MGVEMLSSTGFRIITLFIQVQMQVQKQHPNLWYSKVGSPKQSATKQASKEEYNTKARAHKIGPQEKRGKKEDRPIRQTDTHFQKKNTQLFP